jgi:hypothetical protein
MPSKKIFDIDETPSDLDEKNYEPIVRKSTRINTKRKPVEIESEDEAPEEIAFSKEETDEQLQFIHVPKKTKKVKLVKEKKTKASKGSEEDRLDMSILNAVEEMHKNKQEKDDKENNSQTIIVQTTQSVSRSKKM